MMVWIVRTLGAGAGRAGSSRAAAQLDDLGRPGGAGRRRRAAAPASYACSEVGRRPDPVTSGGGRGSGGRRAGWTVGRAIAS